MLLNNNGNEKGQQLNNGSMLLREEMQAIDSWIAKMGKHHFFDTTAQRMISVTTTLNLQYEIVGHGLNRIVYDLNNGFILKVALSEVGLMANANEAYIYNHCREEVRKYICPVSEFGSGWIIMKKMDTSVRHAVIDYTKLIKLEFIFLKYGMLPIDLRIANVAFSEENKMVVIDYGLFTMDLKSPVLRWFV
ncbi:hypothetical protein ABE28_010145 [Peribacillus muralis]|uniref:Protein kinase domain-containing protein n=1 Tax=Peribacillus muralis TaxID=264697 RepID=A0A1B3XNE3_9BACI|nr:hypothetical protein [Peribacillus muralis]AOH54710.1 hypothetical protein ABE28_010145 [Peribacillus muralis]